MSIQLKVGSMQEAAGAAFGHGSLTIRRMEVVGPIPQDKAGNFDDRRGTRCLDCARHG